MTFDQVKQIIQRRAADARSRAGAWESRGQLKMADVKDAQANELDDLLRELEQLQQSSAEQDKSADGGGESKSG